MSNKILFHKIDILKRKVKRGTRININDACFIVWAELCVPSAVYLDFKDWCKENRIHTSKFKWEIWKGIYKGAYQPLSNDRMSAKSAKIKSDYERRLSSELKT